LQYRHCAVDQHDRAGRAYRQGDAQAGRAVLRRQPGRRLHDESAGRPEQDCTRTRIRADDLARAGDWRNRVVPEDQSGAAGVTELLRPCSLKLNQLRLIRSSAIPTGYDGLFPRVQAWAPAPSHDYRLRPLLSLAYVR